MKIYNNEKAIISLTSWKARINTVSKTIFSLLTMCPNFHIVLVLSEEEFPQKEKELPENLMLFVNNNLIEILWVYKNYKSFKKVLFTIDKYKDVPVISADDDCIYLKNYAQTLYDCYLNNDKISGIYYISTTGGTGWGALFSPNIFDTCWKNYLIPEILNTNNDDVFYITLLKKNNLPRINLHTNRFDYVYFHNEVNSIGACFDLVKNNKAHYICKKIIL